MFWEWYSLCKRNYVQFRGISLFSVYLFYYQVVAFVLLSYGSAHF